MVSWLRAIAIEDMEMAGEGRIGEGGGVRLISTKCSVLDS
jgi:hypothetical protein